MLKFAILLGLATLTIAGVIHDAEEAAHHQDGDVAETEHHHHVNHKHAESHQSVKFIHYHPVPVYVKKEDQKYLHHPVEIGSNKHKVKLIHPETAHAKGYGLELENHQETISHKIEPHHHHHEYKHEEPQPHHEPEVYEPQSEYDFAGYEAAHQ